mgnify:FL=1
MRHEKPEQSTLLWEKGSGISGKADGRVKNMPERFPYNKEGAFFVYDRIMNLSKLF